MEKLFVQLATDYPTGREEFFKRYAQDTKILTDYAYFLADEENHERYELSLSSIEKFCTDIDLAGFHHLMIIIISSTISRDLICDSDIIFYMNSRFQKFEGPAKVLMLSEDELKNIAKQFNLHAEVERRYTYFRSQKGEMRLGIEFYTARNEIIFHPIPHMIYCDYELLASIKNEIEKALIQKAERKEHRLFYVTGEYQIRKF